MDKYVNFIPSVGDRAMDDYFALFERAAEVLQWPKSVWPLLLQKVLPGKAQEAQASLSTVDSGEYEKVKAVVLLSYKSEPEVCGVKSGHLGKTGDDLAEEKVLNKHVAPSCINPSSSGMVVQHPKVVPVCTTADVQAENLGQDEFEDFPDLSDSFMAHLEDPVQQPVALHARISGHETRLCGLSPPCMPFPKTTSVAVTKFPQKQKVSEQNRDFSSKPLFYMVADGSRTKNSNHALHEGLLYESALFSQGSGFLCPFPVLRGVSKRAVDCDAPFPCIEECNTFLLRNKHPEAIYSATEPVFVCWTVRSLQDRWLCDDEMEKYPTCCVIYALGLRQVCVVAKQNLFVGFFPC